MLCQLKYGKCLPLPYYISQYLSDGTIHCHCTEGSPITLINDSEENKVSINKGNILQVVPGVLLKYNWQEGEKFIIITYQLIPYKDGIELKFHCEGFDDNDEECFSRPQ